MFKVLAAICVPWMLMAKPLLQKKETIKEKETISSSFSDVRKPLLISEIEMVIIFLVFVKFLSL